MTPDTLCPNCSRTAPVRDPTDPEAVKCPDCGWITDFYEAYKQRQNHQPECYVDSKPATHFAPIKRRFFCASCASHQGLTDARKIEVPS